jgi:hypothetical protein
MACHLPMAVICTRSTNSNDEAVLMEHGAAGLLGLSNDVNVFAVNYIGCHGAGAARAREAARLNCWEADEAKLVALYRRLLGAAHASA